MYQNVQTCILEVNSTRIDIVQGLHYHTQRARLKTCIAITKNTQIHESTRGHIRAVHTNSVSFPYNNMIYYPKLKSNYFHHC